MLFWRRWLLRFTDLSPTTAAKHGETPCHVAAVLGNTDCLKVREKERERERERERDGVGEGEGEGGRGRKRGRGRGEGRERERSTALLSIKLLSSTGDAGCRCERRGVCRK